MSQSGRYTPDVPAGKYIEEILGDIGSVSGAVVEFNANPQAGATIFFSGSGTLMLLNVTDLNGNTIFGENAGNSGVSGTDNTAFGAHALEDMTTGSNNCMFGVGAGSTLTTASDCVGVGESCFGSGATTSSRSIGIGTSTLENCNGSYNVAVGYNAGFNYASSESSNILINNTGTLGESHVLRIGAGTGSGNQQLSKAYISGIDGVNVGSSTVRVVTENADQLGTANITAGTGITITPSANTITIGVTGGIAITEIDGDVGSVAGSTVAFHANTTAGKTVEFSGTISTMNLLVTDTNDNTIIGNGAGGIIAIAGSHNTGLGFESLVGITSGNNNTAIGFQAGKTLSTGSGNIYLGIIDAAGAAEANTTRIGNTGLTSACYVLGINGVNVGSTATVVTESGDKLGTAVITAGTGITVTPSANAITVATNGTGLLAYTSINAASSPYTVLTTDSYISADATAGPITVRLPNAPSTGRVFIIKDKVGIAASNNITITTVGGTVTIDGSTSFVMNTAYEAIQVIFGGTNYEVW